MKETGRSEEYRQPDSRRQDDAPGPPLSPTQPVAGASLSMDAIPLDGDIQARIGRQLQDLYAGVLQEATPDRFLKLLADLDRKVPD